MAGIELNLQGKTSVAVEMVCLGNICRSPMAAAVLHNKAVLISAPKILVSSSGTSDYHIGEGAHKSSIATWQGAGYSYDHTARQFSRRSFEDQDLILCMDLTNRAMVLNAAPNESSKSKVFLLRQFDPLLAHIEPTSREASKLVVPDPWGEGMDSFANVLAMIERATDGLVSLIVKQ